MVIETISNRVTSPNILCYDGRITLNAVRLKTATFMLDHVLEFGLESCPDLICQIGRRATGPHCSERLRTGP